MRTDSRSLNLHLDTETLICTNMGFYWLLGIMLYAAQRVLFSKCKKSAKNSWKQFLPKNLHKKYISTTFLDFTPWIFSLITDFPQYFHHFFFRILNSLCTQVTHTLRKCKMPAVWNCLNDDGGPLWWVAGDPWLLGIPRDNFCVGGKKQRRRLKIWFTVYF